MTALACDDLATEIKEADTPVLLLDTCTILDVVRAPIRDQLTIHDIQAVHTLIGRAADAPPTVSFVISTQVLQEFGEHIVEVEKETGDKLEKTSNEFGAILRRMEALSPNCGFPRAVDLLDLGFPERGRQLADKIVQLSSVLAEDQDDILKAYSRVTRAMPPATRTKQSVKDCHITESYLRLAASLCCCGFSRNMVFASSNTKDYQQGHQSLHPALRTEFDSVCLEYSPNWSAARHELDRR